MAATGKLDPRRTEARFHGGAARLRNVQEPIRKRLAGRSRVRYYCALGGGGAVCGRDDGNERNCHHGERSVRRGARCHRHGPHPPPTPPTHPPTHPPAPHRCELWLPHRWRQVRQTHPPHRQRNSSSTRPRPDRASARGTRRWAVLYPRNPGQIRDHGASVCGRMGSRLIQTRSVCAAFRRATDRPIIDRY